MPARDEVPGAPSLPRRLLAEFVGTALLLAIVVGSGITAQRLSPGDVGLQLFEHGFATAAGLGVLILLIGPISGAHLNPLVSGIDWLLGYRSGNGLSAVALGGYTVAQLVGAVTGTLLAHLMFDLETLQASDHDRATTGTMFGEVVATAGLIWVVLALARTGRTAWSALTISAYVASAIWFTSSYAFMNPAVTLGRMLTDTFVGIAPASVAPYVVAQTLGAVLGLGLALILYPDLPRVADGVVVPRGAATGPDQP